MNRFILYIFLISIFALGFSIKFLSKFEEQKNITLTKYQLETKTTSLFIKENLKKYLENRDIEILNTINSVFNNNFSSIFIEKALFSIKEKDLINLTSNLDLNLSWELSNLQIDNRVGELFLSTQSDDLQKELLTIEGSIPNEINKNLIPSSDIYTFVPNQNFRNLSSLFIKFDATNQLDETKNSNVLINFEKNISSFSNKKEANIAPKWFKDLIPIYIPEEASKVNNSLQNDAIFYINTNIEKIYFELFQEAKKEFFSNLLWIFILFASIIAFEILYRVLRPKY